MCVIYERSQSEPTITTPSSPPLQKEQKFSESVQSADKKSDPGSVAPADSSLVGNNSLFLEALRRDLVDDITKYFKQLDDPTFVPGKRTFLIGMSLAREGKIS